MIFLLFTLFATEAGPTSLQAHTVGAELTIPETLFKPRLYWKDLNDDGVQDIYAVEKVNKLYETEALQNIWVYDGASSTDQFTPVPYRSIGIEPQPVWRDGQWRAQIYHEGLILQFEQDAWRIRLDLNHIARIRPGIDPDDSGPYRLAPTYEGYWLLDGTCLVKDFRVLPAIEVTKRKLSLSYAIPQWRDINGDGQTDLISKPVPFKQKGELRIWSAIRDQDGWNEQWSGLQFPNDLNIGKVATGDLNDDGFEDIVILAQPAKDLSIFEEMSFLVYMGTGPGQWNPVAVQTLKTKQNLWQEGPIEVTEKGVLFYYYKGLIRSHFKMDLFAWHPDGYIQPKPISERWTRKGGDREAIHLNADWNGDGYNDLLLKDKHGLHLFTRDNTAPLPYSKDRSQLLIDPDQPNKDDQGRIYRLSSQIRAGRIYYEGGIAKVASSKGAQLWSLSQKQNGHWRTRRIQ